MRLKIYMLDFTTVVGLNFSMPGAKVGGVITKAIPGQYTHDGTKTAAQNAAAFTTAFNAAAISGSTAKALKATLVPETALVIFTLLSANDTDELEVGKDNYLSLLVLTDSTVIGVFNSEVTVSNQKVLVTAIISAIAGAFAAK